MFRNQGCTSSWQDDYLKTVCFPLIQYRRHFRCGWLQHPTKRHVDIRVKAQWKAPAQDRQNMVLRNISLHTTLGQNMSRTRDSGGLCLSVSRVCMCLSKSNMFMAITDIRKSARFHDFSPCFLRIPVIVDRCYKTVLPGRHELLPILVSIPQSTPYVWQPFTSHETLDGPVPGAKILRPVQSPPSHSIPFHSIP
jgi:hypothetical protein